MHHRYKNEILRWFKESVDDLKSVDTEIREMAKCKACALNTLADMEQHIHETYQLVSQALAARSVQRQPIIN